MDKTPMPTRARLHRGDFLSVETRSTVMSRIRGSGTKPELAIGLALRGSGIDFDEQARDLPGRPDFVIRSKRVAVFVDGDFWHGRAFEAWRLKLSEKWEAKIAANIARDRRNRRRLRKEGWRVIRIWEHQVKASVPKCLARIVRACALPRPVPIQENQGS